MYDKNPSTFGPDYYYVACQPVGKDEVNNPANHPWRGLDTRNTSGTPPTHQRWTYFTPNEETQFVVGEGKFADPNPYGGGASQIENLKVYQFARSFQTIRESYNFTMTRDDFIGAGGLGNHFFSNPDFWTTDLLNGTYIENASIRNAAILDLAADKIQAGRIVVRLTAGPEGGSDPTDKIIIDGPNSRIVIKD